MISLNETDRSNNIISKNSESYNAIINDDQQSICSVTSSKMNNIINKSGSNYKNRKLDHNLRDKLSDFDESNNIHFENKDDEP